MQLRESLLTSKINQHFGLFYCHFSLLQPSSPSYRRGQVAMSHGCCFQLYTVCRESTRNNITIRARESLMTVAQHTFCLHILCLCCTIPCWDEVISLIMEGLSEEDILIQPSFPTSAINGDQYQFGRYGACKRLAHRTAHAIIMHPKMSTPCDCTQHSQLKGKKL